jgi:hypothetical protein
VTSNRLRVTDTKHPPHPEGKRGKYRRSHDLKTERPAEEDVGLDPERTNDDRRDVDAASARVLAHTEEADESEGILVAHEENNAEIVEPLPEPCGAAMISRGKCPSDNATQGRESERHRENRVALSGQEVI